MNLYINSRDHLKDIICYYYLNFENKEMEAQKSK